jgi:hypothetical protein
LRRQVVGHLLPAAAQQHRSRVRAGRVADHRDAAKGRRRARPHVRQTQASAFTICSVMCSTVTVRRQRVVGHHHHRTRGGEGGATKDWSLLSSDRQ